MFGKTNYAQRQFLKELANLLEKHNTKIVMAQCYGEVEGMYFNIGGKRTESFCCELKPSTIRSAIKMGEM